jgi:acyl-CoA dehydrogenase
MAGRGRHVTLAPPEDNEQTPLLLSRDTTEVEADGDAVYSCTTDPHSHLPVYTSIHRIRRDIISVVEDYLSLEQLRDVKINLTVVRPLVDQFYQLHDVSISESPPPDLSWQSNMLIFRPA